MQLLSPTPFTELRRASALSEDTFVFLRAHVNIFTISPRLRWAAFAGVLLHVAGTRALLASTIPPRFKESNGRIVRQDARVCSYTRMLTSRTIEYVVSVRSARYHWITHTRRVEHSVRSASCGISLTQGNLMHIFRVICILSAGSHAFISRYDGVA